MLERKVIQEPVHRDNRIRVQTPIKRESTSRPTSHIRINVSSKSRRPKTVSFEESQIMRFNQDEVNLIKRVRYQEHRNTELEKDLVRRRQKIQKALKTMDALARRDHIDGRNSYKNKWNRINTKVRILETSLDDKKKARSEVENYNTKLRWKIDEMRKALGVMEWNFDSIKKNVIKFSTLTSDIMTKANKFLDEHTEAKAQCEELQDVYVQETLNFESDFNRFVSVVENQRATQEEAIVQERRRMLRAKHEHKKETQKMNNPRGLLTDEEEGAIKKRLESLKAQLRGTDNFAMSQQRKIASMEHAFDLFAAVLEAKEMGLNAVATAKHVERAVHMTKNSSLSKKITNSKIKEIVDTFISNDEELFHLGTVVKDLKNELATEKREMKQSQERLLKQLRGENSCIANDRFEERVKQLAKAKDSIKQMLQACIQKRNRHERELQAFLDGFQAAADALGIFNEVRAEKKDSGPQHRIATRGKKGGIHLSSGNILEFMGIMEIHATEICNKYLKHQAMLKRQAEDIDTSSSKAFSLFQKKKKAKSPKLQSIWGPPTMKNFENTMTTRYVQNEGPSDEGFEIALADTLPRFDLDRPMSVHDARKSLLGSVVASAKRKRSRKPAN